MPRIVLPITLLCLLAVPGPGKESEKPPMPSFSGTIKRIDGKSLVLELDDFRTLDFRRTSKTRFFEKKKKRLDPARLKPGDAVSVEATEDIGGSLTAVNVYLEHAAQGAPPEAQPPEADRLIVMARAAAESFSQTLPNYVCRQVMKRFEGGKAQDVVEAEVIYENGREEYRDVRVNGKAVRRGMEELGGAWSTGEFGSVLHDLFSRGTAARFSFREEVAMAGRTAAVYDYDVARANSHWEVRMASQSIRPAYRGAVWIDKESGRTLRIEMEAMEFPEAFAVAKAVTTNDYEFVRLGDNHEYLLPVRAETVTCERRTGRCARNKIGFGNYRKYSGEAVISFGETGKLR